MCKMRLFLKVALSVFGVTALSGYSANAADCTCVTDPSNGNVGSITRVSGTVNYTGAAGTGAASAGSILVDGSEMTTGVASSAHISVGLTCDMDIRSGRLVTITLPEELKGKICVNVSEDPGLVVDGSSVSPIVPLAIVGGGIGLAVAIGAGSSSKSP